jgi:DNA-binding transcriptional MerR regulator
MMRYRVEDLAEAATTTVRNVRAYQERGLLPPPRREGRIAWYGETHLARLRMIGALLERGYSLANIGELLATWESGSDLRDVLGLEAALTTPFTDEMPQTLSLAEVAEMFGTVDPVALAKAVEIGLFEIVGNEVRAPSMRLVRVGVELHRAGIPLHALLAELASLRSTIDGVARGFVGLVAEHAFGPFERARTRGDKLLRHDAKKLAAFVERVRPMAEIAVDAMLAQALERQVRAQLGERLGRAHANAPPAHTQKKPSRRAGRARP